MKKTAIKFWYSRNYSYFCQRLRTTTLKLSISKQTIKTKKLKLSNNGKDCNIRRDYASFVTRR